MITKHLHIWKLQLSWYYIGEFIIWKKAHCKFSCVLFGHAVHIY